MPSVTVDPEIAPLVRVAGIPCAPVRVGPSPAALRVEIEARVAELKRLYAGKAPGEIDLLVPARRLYRAFGIDPTTTRPSSEALLRRILKGGAFPDVNAAVDVGNLCSISFFLPIGLYDADKIRGGIALRRGRPDEGYSGIRKDRVGLAGRPVLVDDLGPFGNPTSDSLRTSVDAATVALLMVVFAPGDTSEFTLASHVAFAERVMGDRLRISA